MQYLIFEHSLKQVGILKVNRPSLLNALNRETLTELLHLLKAIEEKKECKALILTGAGEKSFIAGADIKEMQTMTPIEMMQFSQLGQDVTKALENASFLTIAAVNGYALGGGLEMALACDFIYASTNAKLGFPEVSLGIIPGFGGTQRFARAVGTRVAKELIMSGRIFSAEEGKSLGIINRICESDSLVQESILTANEIVSHSFLATAQAKRAIDYGYNLGMTEALELEKNMCAVCFATEERVKGMAAFLEKKNKNK